jgi:fibronectin type 3 domain-containing protein
MAKLYDIKLTSANAPDALFTVYYNSVNSATIASLVSNNNPATNLTRAQLITGTGVRVAVPNNATSVLVYSPGCNTTVSAPVVDTTAPTPPTSLTASNVAQTTMTLSWGPGSDSYGVTNYLVYRNGTLIATVGNVLTYDVTGLTAATSYTFVVYARDAAGNVSVASNSLVQATAAAADTTPPTTPFLDPLGDFGGGFLTLTWSASTDASGIYYYDVYREDNNSGIFSIIGQTTATTFDDIYVYDGNGYAYKIKAIDNAINQSAFSNTRPIFYSTGGGGGPLSQ